MPGVLDHSFHFKVAPDVALMWLYGLCSPVQDQAQVVTLAYKLLI